MDKNTGSSNNTHNPYYYDIYSPSFSSLLSLSNASSTLLNFSKASQEANWYLWNIAPIQPSLFDFSPFPKDPIANFMSSLNLNYKGEDRFQKYAKQKFLFFS